MSQPPQEQAETDGNMALADRVQIQRERIFQALSIAECCRLATASVLSRDDPEVTAGALAAVRDLLDIVTMELERVIVDLRRGPAATKPRSEDTCGGD